MFTQPEHQFSSVLSPFEQPQLNQVLKFRIKKLAIITLLIMIQTDRIVAPQTFIQVKYQVPA